MERKLMESETNRQLLDKIIQSSYYKNGNAMYEWLCSLESYQLKDQVLNHRFFRNRMTNEQNLELLKSYFNDPVIKTRITTKEQKLEDYYLKRMSRDHALTNPKIISDDYGRKFTNILVEIYSVQKDTLVKLSTKYPKKFSPEAKDEMLELDVLREAIIHKWTDPLEKKVTDTFFKGGINHIQDRRVQKALETNLIHDLPADILVGILKRLYTNETKKQMLETAVAWGKFSLNDVQQVILTFDQTPQVLLEKQLCNSKHQQKAITDRVICEQEETFCHLIDTYSVLLSVDEEGKTVVKEDFQSRLQQKRKLYEQEGTFVEEQTITKAFVKMK